MKRLAIASAAVALSGCFSYTLPVLDAPIDEGIDGPGEDADLEVRDDGGSDPEIHPEPLDGVDGDDAGGEDAAETEGEQPDVADAEEGEPSACGNGVVEPPDEECDGNPDETCLSPCRTTGTRRCMSCRWMCTPPPDDNCNGVDDDCDSVCDEGYYTTATCGLGPCERFYECSCGSETCRPGTPLSPTDPNCNGVDEDCDGRTDEEYIPYTCGAGDCTALSTCDAGVEDCTPGPPESLDDDCDGRDENCDGVADEGYIPVSCGVGECRVLSVCEGGFETCTPLPSQPEICGNGLDEDCNGVPDNGCGGRVPAPGELLINEFLAAPAMDLTGDANCDGVRDAADDEFVEIVNVSTELILLGGISVSDSVSIRHTFPAGKSLSPGKAVVVYGGGAPACSLPADVQIFTASTGQLALNNAGDTITISDAVGTVINEAIYGASADNAQSLTLNPDLDDQDPAPASVTGFELHTAADVIDQSRFSPGTHIDGAPF